jgi:hypothetical protein
VLLLPLPPLLTRPCSHSPLPSACLPLFVFPPPLFIFPRPCSHLRLPPAFVRVCGCSGCCWSRRCSPASVLFAFVRIPLSSITFAPPACLHSVCGCCWLLARVHSIRLCSYSLALDRIHPSCSPSFVLAAVKCGWAGFWVVGTGGWRCGCSCCVAAANAAAAACRFRSCHCSPTLVRIPSRPHAFMFSEHHG